MSNVRPTAWVGWIYFASVMMILVGGMQVIAGLVAIFKEEYYVAGPNALVAFDFTAWGWIHLVLGVLVFAAGFALLAGRLWARILATLLIVLSALSQLAFLGAYPLWSIIAISIDALVLYAVTMHGSELE